MEFTIEQKVRHDLINIITRKYADTFLKDKPLTVAAEESRVIISDALESKKISNKIYDDLVNVINKTFI